MFAQRFFYQWTCELKMTVHEKTSTDVKIANKLKVELDKCYYSGLVSKWWELLDYKNYKNIRPFSSSDSASVCDQPAVYHEAFCYRLGFWRKLSSGSDLLGMWLTTIYLASFHRFSFLISDLLATNPQHYLIHYY